MPRGVTVSKFNTACEPANTAFGFHSSPGETQTTADTVIEVKGGDAFSVVNFGAAKSNLAPPRMAAPPMSMAFDMLPHSMMNNASAPPRPR